MKLIREEIRQRSERFGIYEYEPLEIVPSTAKFINHTNPFEKIMTIYMNEIQRFPLKQFNALSQAFVLNIPLFHFNKKVIN